MADADALRALLEKVEVAGGPDRETDALLWCVEDSRDPVWRDGMLLGRARIAPFDEAYIGCEWGLTFKNVVSFPHYTESLDAAVALAEALLPAIKAFAPGSPSSSGWKINLYRGMTPTGEPHASWECCIRPHAGAETWHRAPTAALAVLSALLAALLARADHPNP